MLLADVANSGHPTRIRRDDEVDHVLLRLQWPDLSQCLSQLFVGFVHFLHRPHLDAQRFSDQGEQCRREMHRPVLRHRHVHADQVLVGQTIGALSTEPNGRCDVSQHLVHLLVRYATTKT